MVDTNVNSANALTIENRLNHVNIQQEIQCASNTRVFYKTLSCIVKYIVLLYVRMEIGTNFNQMIGIKCTIYLGTSVKQPVLFSILLIVLLINFTKSIIIIYK